MLLPRICGACGSPGPWLCAACAAQLEPADPVVLPPGLDRCAAVLRYDGVGRDLVVGLKYRNRRATVAPLVAAMAALVDPLEVDVVTWAPTSPGRRRLRGYDQARLLAVGVARRLGRPCRDLLRRRAGPPQTGRTGDERRVGPAFECRRPISGRVLVVDDVVTTGATLSSAARALRAGGASDVQGVTSASTFLKVPRREADKGGTQTAKREPA